MKLNWISSTTFALLSLFFLTACGDDSADLIGIDEYLAANSITAIEDPSGLKYVITKEGTGEMPILSDKISAIYTGTRTDGKEFDSSRGNPITFPLENVIRGWQIAFPKFKVGTQATLYIPSELAYGSRGAGNVIGPNTDLIFEVELVSIVE